MIVDVKSNQFDIPKSMKAWVLGDPDELSYVDKPVPVPGKAEVFVRIDAIVVCGTDLEVISHGPPAMIQGGLPFNKNWTPRLRIYGNRGCSVKESMNSTLVIGLL